MQCKLKKGPSFVLCKSIKNGQQFYIREKLSVATLQGILVSNGRRTYKTNKIMLMVYGKKNPHSIGGGVY